MPTEGGRVERRQPIRGGATPPHPPEPENLPCPRCDSTNTKFCYYNNYNLSQPRYFCKGCRRYWTRGGTLRNVPVGGGSRKTSKRSRFSSSSSSAATASTTLLQPPHPIPAVPINTMPSSSESDVMIKAEIPYDLNLNEGSFTSLLTANVAALQGDGFFSYELGHGYGSSAPESYVSGNDAGGNDGHAWHLGGFDGGGGGGGALPVNVVDGGDNYFAWSDLAISTPRQALE